MFTLVLTHKVDLALKDSFNKPLVVKHLIDFKTHVNRYLIQGGTLNLIIQIRDYYHKILSLFGIEYLNIKNDDISEQLLDTLVNYRSAIRNAAKNTDFKMIYQLSDNLRDIKLPERGIKLTDQGSMSAWAYIV